MEEIYKHNITEEEWDKFYSLPLDSSKPSLKNVDLNDYVVPGIYRVFNAADAATIQNVPPSLSGGKLVVESLGADSAVQQTWYSHSVSAATYRRYGSNTKEWNPWVRVLTDHFNSYSQTKNGFTTTAFVIQPRLVSLRIRGKNENSIDTSSGYIDVGTFEIFRKLSSSSVIKYLLANGLYSIQLNILGSGEVHIGYTRNLTNGAAASLPSSSTVYIEDVLMIR